MKRQFILFIVTAFFSASCGKFYRLTAEDYAWMPYTGNETLVFRSNISSTDTLFLVKKDTLTAYPEAQSLNGTTYQLLSVFCKHAYIGDGGEWLGYLENSLFTVKRAKDNRAELVLDLSASDAQFYRLSTIKTDSLSKIKPVTLRTAFYQYTDVYIFDGEDYLGNLYQRRDFITKVYWSKSQGLVRYDKRNGVHWELEKKY